MRTICAQKVNGMPPKLKPETAGEWECMECGYIEKGVESHRPPECHGCGASSRALEFFPGDDWDDERSDDEFDEFDDMDEDDEEDEG